MIDFCLAQRRCARFGSWMGQDECVKCGCQIKHCLQSHSGWPRAGVAIPTPESPACSPSFLTTGLTRQHLATHPLAGARAPSPGGASRGRGAWIDHLLVLYDKEKKSQTLPKRRGRGKWQGLHGQSTWEPLGRSWGSQALPSDSASSDPEFLQSSIAIPCCFISLSTPGATPSSLPASGPLPYIFQDTARELSISPQPTPIPPFPHRILQLCFAGIEASPERPGLPSGDGGGTFSPCLLHKAQLKAGNSGCLGQWREHCARSQETLV